MHWKSIRLSKHQLWSALNKHSYHCIGIAAVTSIWMSSNPGQLDAISKLQHGKNALLLFGENSLELWDCSMLLILKRDSLLCSEEPSCKWHDNHRTRMTGHCPKQPGVIRLAFSMAKRLLEFNSSLHYSVIICNDPKKQRKLRQSEVLL